MAKSGTASGRLPVKMDLITWLDCTGEIWIVRALTIDGWGNLRLFIAGWWKLGFYDRK